MPANKPQAPNQQLADTLRTVTAAIQAELDSGRRSSRIDAHDLVDILLSVADDIDPEFGPPSEPVPHQVVIADDMLGVMDHDGDVLDGVPLTNLRAAKRQVKEWISKYTFDVADTYRLLTDHFSGR